MALITDYGYEDPYAGIMKIVAKEVCNDVDIIDVTHGIRPFDVLEGAVTALVTLKHLPKGSSLVVVVDPGVGSEREAVAASVGGRYLVGPNNGVLWLAAKELGVERVVRIEKRLTKYYSYTFHGRDLFAPAGAYLACGGRLEDLGPESSLKPLPFDLTFKVSGKRLEATVVYVDRFGNVMTWAKEAPFEIGEIIKVNGVPAKFVRTFSEVRPGELAVYFNSFGYLEVAEYMGNASKRLGVGPGERVVMEA